MVFRGGRSVGALVSGWDERSGIRRQENISVGGKFPSRRGKRGDPTAKVRLRNTIKGTQLKGSPKKNTMSSPTTPVAEEQKAPG